MSLSFAVLLEVIYIYFLYGMGRFIENYDYASPDKLASQNGLNLSSAFFFRPVALLLQNAGPQVLQHCRGDLSLRQRLGPAAVPC